MKPVHVCWVTHRHMNECFEHRYRTEGLASIIYVQSDCDAPSDRDLLVGWMMQYIPIDSYGACVHNKDLPPQ